MLYIYAIRYTMGPKILVRDEGIEPFRQPPDFIVGNGFTDCRQEYPSNSNPQYFIAREAIRHTEKNPTAQYFIRVRSPNPNAYPHCSWNTYMKVWTKQYPSPARETTMRIMKNQFAIW